MASIDEGVVELANGRRLGYAEWGPADAPTVIHCHGTPSCRIELRLAHHAIERHRIAARVIAFDRPGYGLSSFKPRYRFLDWPADVAEAADRMGVGRFAVLGASGGSPPALACGYLLADRVTRIGIVVGSGPPEASGMERSALARLTSARSWIRRLQYGGIALAFTLGRGERVVAKSLESMGPADRAAMEQAHVRRWFLDLFRESLVQGGRAAAHEAGLLLRPWGFEIGDIQQPVSLYYAGRDNHVPAEVGRWLADRLPNSRFSVWPEHGHFTWAESDDVAGVVAGLIA